MRQFKLVYRTGDEDLVEAESISEAREIGEEFGHVAKVIALGPLNGGDDDGDEDEWENPDDEDADDEE